MFEMQSSLFKVGGIFVQGQRSKLDKVGDLSFDHSLCEV
jgi:hypothetical protein